MFKQKSLVLVMHTILLAIALSVPASAAGEVDLSFNAQTYLGAGDPIYNRVKTIVQQPDGKILLGGKFKIANGVQKCAIVRLNADRTVDESFNPAEIFSNGSVCNGLETIALQPDGKILVGGTFLGTVGTTFPGIARLNPDGSLDQTFAGQIVPGGIIRDISVQPDGKILLAGSYTYFDPSTNSHQTAGFHRLNVNGSVDVTYPRINATGYSLKTQPDGKTIVYQQNTVIRRNVDGSVDGTFSTVTVNGIVRKIELDSNGKILIGGEFTTVNGFTKSYLARINSDGSLDVDFNTNSSGPNHFIYDIKIAPDGKIFIGGSFSQFNNNTNLRRGVRLNSDGTPDISFLSTVNLIVFSLQPLPDGKVLTGIGYQDGITPGPEFNPVVLLNADGSTDNSLNLILGSNGIVRKILQQPDGKILVGGTFRYVNGNIVKIGVARFNMDGTVDNSFNQIIEQNVTALAVQPDGKILVGRFGGTVRLVRFNPDGSPDATFNPPNTNFYIIHDIEVLPDGKFLVASTGLGQLGLVHRRNADGTIDGTFFTASNFNLNNAAYEIEVQPDGKILVGGNFSEINGGIRGNFARLNADGTIDASFNPPFGANAPVLDIDYQSNGKVVIVGNFTGVNGNNSYKNIARVNTDGSLDTSFSAPPLTYAAGVEIQPDDKILVLDQFLPTGAFAVSRLIRLFPNGSLDNSLTTVANAVIADVKLQSDGKILIGGEFTKVNGVFRTNIARLLNAAQSRTRFDFDGDGKADISVFRPSNGAWYLLQSQNGFTGMVFGLGTDKLVPGDYDGDGKTDIAVFREGIWYLQRSSLGFTGVAFGEPTDIPVPGDYDGDGKTDIAVFRPSNGTWYLLQSSAGFTGVAFGLGTDKPVQADYDGDGKTDIAVNRNGTWYLLRSSLGFTGMVFGDGSDKLVPADYDGDGKADIAVFRPSNGTWYIQRSQLGFTGVAFGLGTDKPVPADYDGDGKADIAVYRDGIWYLLRSTAGFTGVAFGEPTDKPIQNAFVP